MNSVLRKVVLLSVLFVMIGYVSGFACLNEYRRLLNGELTYTDAITMVPYPSFSASDYPRYQKDLADLYQSWKTTKDLEDYSDYGVILTYLKRYTEALDVFLEIEKLDPGRYATAANLGTVYELLGKNTLALDWIRKSVTIDPASHDGSEWLHVRILEAKIKGPKAYTAEFLLPTTFGDDTIPVSKVDTVNLTNLGYQIYYQLRERMSFVDPGDPIVGILLFALGNVYAIDEDVTAALNVYDVAIEYGYRSPVLSKRYAKFFEMQRGLDNQYGKRLASMDRATLSKLDSVLYSSGSDTISAKPANGVQKSTSSSLWWTVLIVCVFSGALVLVWFFRNGRAKENVPD